MTEPLSAELRALAERCPRIPPSVATKELRALADRADQLEAALDRSEARVATLTEAAGEVQMAWRAWDPPRRDTEAIRLDRAIAALAPLDPPGPEEGREE